MVQSYIVPVSAVRDIVSDQRPRPPVNHRGLILHCSIQPCHPAGAELVSKAYSHDCAVLRHQSDSAVRGSRNRCLSSRAQTEGCTTPCGR